jgi:hypothetical protein
VYARGTVGSAPVWRAQIAAQRSSASFTARAPLALVAVVSLAMMGCGGSSTSTKATTAGNLAPPPVLALSISEGAHSSTYTAPASVKGGLLTVTLQNNGKTPHGAQLIRILGGHTLTEMLAALGGQSTKTPAWLRAEGGIGFAPPGATVSATVVLPSGRYAILDAAGADSTQSSAPAVTPITVTAGTPGALPPTATTITAANPSKDHYRWEISGPLRPGLNNVTFVSKGSNAIHELTAVRITGNVSTAQLVKDLESHGPPPSYVEVASKTSTAVLDGGKSLTTQLTLGQAGHYVLFCHLSDRGGGRPHFAEGLITTVTVR